MVGFSLFVWLMLYKSILEKGEASALMLFFPLSHVRSRAFKFVDAAVDSPLPVRCRTEWFKVRGLVILNGVHFSGAL